nr:hypothetical protein [Lachnospiraceae bacterium]
FETDYAKIVSFAGRLNAGANGYAALILGAMPHKVANLGDWSSLVEKCRQSDSLPDAYDARSRSGELKVTKESFKKALMDICLDLKKKRGK